MAHPRRHAARKCRRSSCDHRIAAFSGVHSTYRGGLIPIPSQRSRRSGMGIRLPPGFYLFEYQFTLYPTFPLLAFRHNNRKAASSRRIEQERAADKMTRPQGRGDASRRRGCKLFRHSVAGSNTAEYDALANAARTLIHVAPDRTELASRVQVLNWAAVPSTPQRPSRARLPLRLR